MVPADVLRARNITISNRTRVAWSAHTNVDVQVSETPGLPSDGRPGGGEHFRDVPVPLRWLAAEDMRASTALQSGPPSLSIADPEFCLLNAHRGDPSRRHFLGRSGPEHFPKGAGCGILRDRSPCPRRSATRTA